MTLASNLDIKIKVGTLVIFILLMLGSALSVSAAPNSPVELAVPDTTLTISGKASPNAIVAIYDGESLIGTVSADKSGFFTKTFVALKDGLHNIRLNYVDDQGIESTEISETVNVGFQQNTAFEYFLPPTVLVFPKSVTEGELVTIQGSSVPGATINLSIDGGNVILRPRVGPDGRYSVSFGTTDYFSGQHEVDAWAVKDSEQSYHADPLLFRVKPSLDSDSPSPAPVDVPLTPPIITSPNSPYQTETEPVLIRGTALPNIQIVIYLDGEIIGSTFSNAQGGWFFNLNITGKHQVKAVSCQGFQCSDFSNILLIEITGIASTDPGECSDVSFLLKRYRFWNVQPNSSVSLDFFNIAGVPPFEMIIDWGNANIERFNHNSVDDLSLSTVFKQEGRFNGVVTLQDERGCTETRFFSTEVNIRDFNFRSLWWLVPVSLSAFLIIALSTSQKTNRNKA